MKWSLAHIKYNIYIWISYHHYYHWLQEGQILYLSPSSEMLFQNGSGDEMIEKETKSHPPLAFMNKCSRKAIGGKCIYMKVKPWLCVLKWSFSRAQRSHQFDSWISYSVFMCPVLESYTGPEFSTLLGLELLNHSADSHAAQNMVILNTWSRFSAWHRVPEFIKLIFLLNDPQHDYFLYSRFQSVLSISNHF